MSYQIEKIIEAFSETVGESKGKRVIDEVSKEIGLDGKSELDKDEAVELLEQVADSDDISSLGRTSANTLKMQVLTDSLS